MIKILEEVDAADTFENSLFEDLYSNSFSAEGKGTSLFQMQKFMRVMMDIDEPPTKRPPSIHAEDSSDDEEK